jgi:hypothetical protein
VRIALHDKRPWAELNDLWLRRSSRFSVSSHVGAHLEFQGFETGAQLGTGQPTTLSHRKVFEYQPS